MINQTVMKNFILKFTIIHPQAGLVTVEKQGGALQISYPGNEQRIEWNVPEPLIAISNEDGELCFTYRLSDKATLKKKLYFNNGSFIFRIPDGISYYISCDIENLPFVFFQAREGSSVVLNYPHSMVNLQVNIEKTVCENSISKIYFTEYTFICGNVRKNCRLYAGDSITIGEYWIYQSPRATSWPVFLVNNHAMENEQVDNCCP